MKKTLLLFVCAISMKCYAQKGYTTVYIFANPDCHCTLQFAIGKEPFGEKSPLRRDTMFIGVSPKSSGFYVSCGDSIKYYEIKYRIDGYYKIKIICNPDTSNKALPGEVAGNNNYIQRFTKGPKFPTKRTSFKTSQLDLFDLNTGPTARLKKMT